MPIYLWVVIGLVGLLAISSMGFAIVAPRKAKLVAAQAGGAMTQMTRRMGTVVNRPTAPRIKEIRVQGEGADVRIDTSGLLKGFVVGRDQTLCDAVLTIGNASRRHFRIRHKGGRAVIEDLNSHERHDARRAGIEAISGGTPQIGGQDFDRPGRDDGDDRIRRKPTAPFSCN